MKKRIALITLLALCMALVLSVLPMSIFATESTESELVGTMLTTSHAGKTLSGDYYVEPGKTLTITGSTGKSGLIVESGKTLTIHIPANSTLNVNGGAASGTTGAGAGIEVNSTSTLIITGEGKLNAKGGKAANGSAGANGENANWVDDGNSYIPDGGYGGAGGGGAGAGIGTKGGNGGSRTGWTRGFGGGLTKETESFVNLNWSAPDGQNGNSGSSASACGNIYISADVTYSAVGGAAGTSGGSGGSKGSSDYESDNHWMRGMAGGAGGGGGGAGKSGAGIGTGGGGGGSGGSGGGVGYAWSYRFLGGGGGGGGAGAVGGSGGAWAQDGEVPDCKQFQYFGGIQRYSSSGSSGGTSSGGSGGVGTKVKITNWSATTWQYPYGGNGGTGGAAGSNSTTKSVELLYDVTISIEGELIGTYLASATGFLPGSLEVPTKTGYTFEGFYAGDVQYYDVNGNRTTAKITADTNISAKFTVNSYDYNISGSNGNSSGTLNYGESITLLTPTRDGYLFRGWKISSANGAAINQDAYYTYSPVTPTARMARSSNEITSSFVYNGDVAMTAGVEKIGQSVTLYNLSAESDAQFNIEEVWVLDSFTATFKDFDGEILGTANGRYGTPLTAPELRNNQNEYYTYTFKYWKCNIDGNYYTSEQLPFLGAFISDYENSLGDKVYSGVTFTAVYDITEYKKELHFVGSLGNDNLDNGTLVLGSGDTNIDVITNFTITKNDGVASLLLMPQYDASAFTIKAISVNGQLIYNNYAAIDAISDANTSALLEGFTATVTGNDKTANDPIKILLDNLTPDNSTSNDDVFIQIVYVMKEAIGGEYNFGFVTKTPTVTDNITHGDRSEAYGTYDPNADDDTDAYKFNELNITVDSTAIKVVIRATGSITIDANQSFIYNGQNMSAADVSQNILNVLQYEYNGYHKKNDDTLTITWYDANGGRLNEAPKNAGTYYIGISAAETTYYSAVREVTAQFTITKYEIYVNAGNQSFEYNGNDIVINGAASNAVLKDAQGNLISVDSFVYSDLALTGVTLVDSYKNAGVYTNAIQGVISGSLDNYVIVYENGTLTITKAENDWVILPSDKTVEYTGAGVEIDGVTADFGTVKIEYLVGYEKNADGDYVLDANGDRIPIWSETPPTNAGTYPVRVTVADNNNFEGLEYQVTLVITKKVISADGFTFEAIDKIYNGQAQYWTLDPNNDKNTSDAEVKILASDANALILQYVKFAGMIHPVDCVNAGTHTIQAVISISNPNYTFVLNGEEVDTWTYDVAVKILKLNIVINANNQSADYTGSEPTVNQGQNYVTITLEDGTAAPDYIIRDLFATVRDSYVLATKYDANATYYRLSNGVYFETALTEAQFNENLANAGSDKYEEYYIKVTLNPETLTLSKKAGVNAGVYALIATLGENSNYNVVTCTGKFTINKAKVEVPKIDCLIYNAAEQKPEVPVEFKDIYKFVFADGEYKNYGLYFLTAQLIDPDNYEWANVVWIDNSVYADSNDIYVPYSNIGNIGEKGEGDATIIVSGTVLSNLKGYNYINFPIWVGTQYKDSEISATSEDLILPWYIEQKVVILVVPGATQEYQYGINSSEIAWGNAYWKSEYAPIEGDNNIGINKVRYGLKVTYPTVGTYTAELLDYTQFNPNYVVCVEGGSVTIIKKVLTQDDLTSNIEAQIKYYTGSKLVLEGNDFTISLHKPNSAYDVFSVTNIVIGDLVNANGYVGQNGFVYYDETNGKYYVQVTVKLEDTANYELGEGVNATFKVEAYIARTENSWTSGPSVDATGATNFEKISHSAEALFGGKNYTVNFYTDAACQNLANGNIDEKATYYAKFTVEGNNNYDGLETIIVFTGKQITIIKPVVRFDSETGTMVYAGEEITIIYDGNVHSFYVPTNDKYTVTVTGDEWKNVGTYTVTITLNATNCAWNDGTNGALVYTLKIAPKSLTITADNKVITFGDNAPTYTVTANGLVNGETLESLLGDALASYISCGYNKGNNAGTYDINILDTIKDVLSNYKVNTASGVLTVNKLVFDYNDIKSSDGTSFENLINNGPSYIYDSESKEVIVGNLPEELEVTITYKDKDGNVLEGKPTNAGEYTVEITVTVKDGYNSNNYDIPENAEIKLTIEKARITITIGDQEYDYTGNNHSSAILSGNYTVTVNNGQTLTDSVTLTVNGEYINVGVYYDVISATHNYNTNNYIVTIENGTLTIKKVDNSWITELNAKNDITYDKAPVTSGVDFFSDPKFGDSDIKYTFYEKVGEIWVELSTAPTQAGEYAVVATVPGTNNYNALDSELVEFRILKRTITLAGIEFNGATVTYNGQQHDIYVTGESSDVFAITYDNNGQINAGTYTVTATFVLADERNYVFDNAVDTMTATLKIEKVSVTITEISNWSVYGESIKNLTYNIEFGGAEEDESFYVTNFGRVVLSTSATSFSNVGTDYEIIVNYAANDNYKVTVVDAYYEIRKFTGNQIINLTASDVRYLMDLVYSASAKRGTVVFTFSTSENGEYTSVLPKNVGTYYVKATVVGTDNYDGASATTSFKITKATLSAISGITYNADTATWTAVITTTDGKRIDCNVTYLVDGVNLTVTSFKATKAGSFTVIAVPSDTANYENSAAVTLKTVYSVSFADKVANHEKQQSLADLTGAAFATQYRFEGQAVTMPSQNPTVVGYTFRKWQLNDADYSFASGVTSNITLYADWTINRYTLYFYNEVVTGSNIVNGVFQEGTVGTEQYYTYTVEYGSPFNLTGVTIPTKSGDVVYDYSFTHWSDVLRGDALDSTIYVYDDMDLYAVYARVAKEFTITYMVSVDGGAYTQHTVVTLPYGADLISLGEVAWFIGDTWYIDSDRQTSAPNFVPAGNMTLYGAYVFDIGAGDVNADGKVNTDDIVNYRRWVVGGYNIVTVEAGAEWALVTSDEYNSSTVYYLVRVSDANRDESGDIRDITTIRMALTGGYGYDYVSGRDSAAGVTGEGVVIISQHISNVSTEESFKAALENGGFVQLTENITLTETVTISKDTVIYLNGHNLDMSANTSRPFNMGSNASLTIYGDDEEVKVGKYGLVNIPVGTDNVSIVLEGGTYLASTDNGSFIKPRGEGSISIELKNVTLTDSSDENYAIDASSYVGGNLSIKVIGGTYDVWTGFVFDGPATNEFELENVTIIARYQGVTVGGDKTCSIEEAGHVTINNCNIDVQVDLTKDDYSAEMGCITAGYGAQITVTNSTLKSNIHIASICSGNGNSAIKLNNCTTEFDSETYEKYKFFKQGTIMVDDNRVVAGVNTTEALTEALTSGGPVAFTGDVTLSETVTISKDTVIYLNGYDFDASSISGTRTFVMANDAKLVIYAEGSNINISEYGFVIIPGTANNSSVAIYGGNFSSDSTIRGAFIRLEDYGSMDASVVLNGVKLTYAVGSFLYGDCLSGNVTVDITDCEVVSRIGVVIDSPVNEITITDSTFNCSYQGISVGGAADEDPTKYADVTIDGCEITVTRVTTDNVSGQEACLVVGYGGKISIYNSTLSSETSYIAGICSWPEYSEITITNCNINYDSEINPVTMFYEVEGSEVVVIND